MSAAVARWVGEGKRIVYALASSGEKGIAGMDPDEAGPLREQEQREAASIVGVDEVEFWASPTATSPTVRPCAPGSPRRSWPSTPT